MTVTGVADCAILAILGTVCTTIALQLRCLGLRGLPLLRVSLPAPTPVPAPLSAPPASWEPPEACCSTAGVVSGLFGRSFRGTAPEICRLWVPAAGVAVVVVGGRVCSCQRIHRREVIVGGGNDEWGGAAWKE